MIVIFFLMAPLVVEEPYAFILVLSADKSQTDQESDELDSRKR